MRATLHSKVAFRAAQIKGGAEELAQFLELPLETVQAWVRAETSVPDEYLFRLFDIFTEGLLAEIGSQPRTRSNDPNPQH